jgi:hypothetical protein
MTVETMQLIAALAPVAEEVVIRGANVVATFAADVTAERLAETLQKSKSANWPKLDFTPGPK